MWKKLKFWVINGFQLKRLIPSNHQRRMLAEDAKVVELIDQDTKWWKTFLIKDIFITSGLQQSTSNKRKSAKEMYIKDSFCIFCNLESESVAHILWNCPTTNVWGALWEKGAKELWGWGKFYKCPRNISRQVLGGGRRKVTENMTVLTIASFGSLFCHVFKIEQ